MKMATKELQAPYTAKREMPAPAAQRKGCLRTSDMTSPLFSLRSLFFSWGDDACHMRSSRRLMRRTRASMSVRLASIGACLVGALDGCLAFQRLLRVGRALAESSWRVLGRGTILLALRVEFSRKQGRVPGWRSGDREKATAEGLKQGVAQAREN